jgi:hypothetical protein
MISTETTGMDETQAYRLRERDFRIATDAGVDALSCIGPVGQSDSSSRSSHAAA